MTLSYGESVLLPTDTAYSAITLWPGNPFAPLRARMYTSRPRSAAFSLHARVGRPWPRGRICGSGEQETTRESALHLFMRLVNCRG